MLDLRADELRAGLVLHLDPISLKQAGGHHYSPEGFRIPGDHYFLCVLIEGDDTYWVPLSSKPGELRLKVERSEKRGHPMWTQVDSYAIASQSWMAKASAIVEAATVANERSRRGARNTVTDTGVDIVRKALKAYL